MKILYYLPSRGELMYDWQQVHIVGELRQAGHIVSVLNPCDLTAVPWLDAADFQRVMEQCIASVGGGDWELLFVGTAHRLVPLPLICHLKQRGIPAVMLFVDDLIVPYRIRRIAKFFELIWITTPVNGELIKSYGGRPIVLPLAANPHVFTPVKRDEKRYVGFLGSCYGARRLRLEQLFAAGVPVRAFVPGGSTVLQTQTQGNPMSRVLRRSWRGAMEVPRLLKFPAGRKCLAAAVLRSVRETRRHKASPRTTLPSNIWSQSPVLQDFPAFYAEAALSMGSNEVWSSYVLRNPVYLTRLREFEAAASGAMHLANRFPELQACFSEDNEMIYYGSAEELIDKAKYYLAPARDSARALIRKQARTRAESDHTWLKRFGLLWRELGL